MKAFTIATLLTALSLTSAAPAPKQVTVNGVSATLSAGSSDVKINAAYSCPQGEYLTYSIKTQPWSGVSLSKAQAALGKWIQSAPGNLVSQSGSGGVGSTRTWSTRDSGLGEGGNNFDTLTNVIPPSSGNSNLEQKWTSGKQTYYNNGLTLFNSWHDLTVSQANGKSVTLQYYINTCASDQNKAYSALSSVLQDSLSFWITEAQS